MNVEKVAVIFNYSVPYSTGHYLVKEMKKKWRVDLFVPEDIRRLKPGSHDLYFCVDDGGFYLFPERLKPSAIWIIDSHTAYYPKLIMAKQFDFTFTAQKNIADKLKKEGFNAYWLPLACAPEFHGKKQQDKKYNVAFIGVDGFGPRRKMINRIRKEFPHSHIGMADCEKIGEIYSASKVVFNRSISDDLNMRVFEGLCSGSLLITNRRAQGQAELFKDGQDLVEYDSEEEAMELIRYYIKNENEREKIAFNGMNKVSSLHTYEHRFARILEIIGKFEFFTINKHKNVFLDGIFFRVSVFFYKIKYKFLFKFG